MEGQQGKVWQPGPIPLPSQGHQGSSGHWEPPWVWAEAEPGHGPTGGHQQCLAVGSWRPALLWNHSRVIPRELTRGPRLWDAGGAQWGGLGHSSPLPKPTLTAAVIPI